MTTKGAKDTKRGEKTSDRPRMDANEREWKKVRHREHRGHGAEGI
jgi:hypothetical protein